MPTTLAQAEKLAAGAAAKKTGRRLTAAAEEGGAQWYWCRNSKTKAWEKCDATSSGSTSRGNDTLVAAAAAAASGDRSVSAAANEHSWVYSNTGGWYSWVPRPLLNTWVVSRPLLLLLRVLHANGGGAELGRLQPVVLRPGCSC